jgi:hypothetical protein
MMKHHDVRNAQVSDGVLSVVIDGSPLSANLRLLSPLLRQATDEELQDFQVSPSGYGIHWPRIDEDLSIDGLLGITHEPAVTRRSA